MLGSTPQCVLCGVGGILGILIYAEAYQLKLVNTKFLSTRRSTVTPIAYRKTYQQLVDSLKLVSLENVLGAVNVRAMLYVGVCATRESVCISWWCPEDDPTSQSLQAPHRRRVVADA